MFEKSGFCWETRCEGYAKRDFGLLGAFLRKAELDYWVDFPRLVGGNGSKGSQMQNWVNDLLTI